MPMSHGVNRKVPSIVSPDPSPLPGFHQVCCFTRNTISTFFCFDQIIAKIMHFQGKTNFSFNSLLVGFDFVVLGMCFLEHFFTALPS